MAHVLYHYYVFYVVLLIYQVIVKSVIPVKGGLDISLRESSPLFSPKATLDYHAKGCRDRE